MESENRSIQIASLVTALAGIWLGVSAGLYQLDGFAFWNQIAVGLALVVIGVAELYTRTRWVSWLAGAAAVWLIVASFIVDASALTFWSAVVTALVVLGMSAWEDNVVSHSGGAQPQAH